MMWRPMLFSGPMVRAILDDRKTKTRRVVSDATSQGNYRASSMDLARAWIDPGPSPAGNPGPYLKSFLTDETNRRLGFERDDIVDRLYPRWFAGDRLWVRETWRCVDGSPRFGGEAAYRADVLIGQDSHNGEWKPSIHMPRWASRLTLEIISVRVERLQEITDDDAEAEGISIIGGRMAEGDYRGFFKSLWNQLNAKRGYGWDVNPWIWVLSFRRIAQQAAA